MRKIEEVICENIEEKKRNIRELKCDKLIINFFYFLSPQYDKKNIKIKYFDTDDLYEITQNENIREVVYKYNNSTGIYQTERIFKSVQPILSFELSGDSCIANYFNFFKNFSYLNHKCRILKILNAPSDYCIRFYSVNNHTLLKIEGVRLDNTDTNWLRRNNICFQKTKQKALSQNIERVSLLRKKFYFPKDIFNILVNKLYEEFPPF